MMPSPKNYDYLSLIEEVDLFAERMGNLKFSGVWEYTKKMMETHAKQMNDLALAWEEFENTFKGEEDIPSQYHIPLQGLIMNLVVALPEHEQENFHRSIDIGFGRARGLGRCAALLMHQEVILQMQAGNAVPSLILIEGGKK